MDEEEEEEDVGADVGDEEDVEQDGRGRCIVCMIVRQDRAASSAEHAHRLIVRSECRRGSMAGYRR